MLRLREPTQADLTAHRNFLAEFHGRIMRMPFFSLLREEITARVFIYPLTFHVNSSIHNIAIRHTLQHLLPRDSKDYAKFWKLYNGLAEDSRKGLCVANSATQIRMMIW
jgi:hypothetical protein